MNIKKPNNTGILGDYKLKLSKGDIINEGFGCFVCTLAENRDSSKFSKFNREVETDEDIDIINTNTLSVGWYVELEQLNKDNKIIKEGKKIKGFQDSRLSNDLGRLKVVGFLNKFEYIEEKIKEKEKRELKQETKSLVGKIFNVEEKIETKQQEEIKDQLKLGL